MRSEVKNEFSEGFSSESGFYLFVDRTDVATAAVDDFLGGHRATIGSEECVDVCAAITKE